MLTSLLRVNLLQILQGPGEFFGLGSSEITEVENSEPIMPSAGLCRFAFKPICHPLILPTTSSRNQFEKVGIIRNLLATARRPLPFLFKPAEITQLLDGALQMQPRNSLRPLLWQTLIGLLASTGLRVGEALRLKIGEVMLDTDLPHLRIVETKFRKSRLVPLHPTTAQQLCHYAEQRKYLGYDALSDIFFPSEKGKALGQGPVWLSFRRLTKRLGILPLQGGRHPSLHCLRHTFAVERLRQWYRLGVDARAMMPNLSVYLGHLSPQESYWYLTATPELLTAAATAFQRYTEEGGAQ